MISVEEEAEDKDEDDEEADKEVERDSEEEEEEGAEAMCGKFKKSGDDRTEEEEDENGVVFSFSCTSCAVSGEAATGTGEMVPPSVSESSPSEPTGDCSSSAIEAALETCESSRSRG